MNYLEGYVQKGDHQKVNSNESPYPSKLLLHNSRIIFKSQAWKDKIQKKCWQVWKDNVLSTAIFPLLWYFCLLKKKATSFLSSLRPVDQKKAQSSRSAHFNEYISKSIKSWKIMKKWLDDQAFWAIKDHSISYPSQLSEKKNLLFCIVLANILLPSA